MSLVKALALSLALSLICSCFSVSVYAAQISEIRIDQPGADNDEYIELGGAPGEVLSGITYLVLGDGAGGSGVVEAAVSLNDQSISDSGIFVIAEATFNLTNADLVTNLDFENSDNVTHLIVMDFTGAVGDDLDSNDDGVLNVMPFSEILDSVALKESDDGEHLYSSTIVGPSGDFVPGHIFLCDDGWRIGEFDPTSADANDSPGASNNCGDDPVNPSVTEKTIPEIQSEFDESPFDGDVVKTLGVVTADFQRADQLRGFYLQDSLGDGDTNTSDGIFVFTPSLVDMDVNVGDEVELVAEVDEFFGLTELKNVQSIELRSTGNTLAPIVVALPEQVDGELERYEGMLVEIASEMTVSQNFFLSRYGQLTLSAPDEQGVAGRLYQPTNLFSAASQDRIDLAAENARRLLVLDDGQDVSGFGDNPEPVPYIGNPPSVLRVGDSVSNLIGVLDYGRINSASSPARDYRLQPTQLPVFSAKNPREIIPQTTNGTLNVASFNVLNYFTTLDGNGAICGPAADQGCRGADSATELVRQQTKIVAALRAMDADIVGLIEIENNGYGENSAIATLVAALNEEYAGDEYTYVTPQGLSALGGDAIAVGFIYKPNSVVPMGTPATLNTGAFDPNLSDGGRSRQPLAVSFRQLNDNEVFTAVINHFKSKNPPSSPQGNGNDDLGDGQGSWNLRRTEAANDLADWIATDPTGANDPDVLIIGDLNAYAQEDPMLALKNQGYSDLIQRFEGATAYSFIFDGQAGSLDQALANQGLTEQVTGVVEWHINADEPPVLDYNQDFNPAGYYSATPFRSADHDPVIVGLSLTSEAAVVDNDSDGVADKNDACADTLTDAQVSNDGCSGGQLVDKTCEAFFIDTPKVYLRCVLYTAVKAYRDELLTRYEVGVIYYKAIMRVFFSRF